MHACSGEGSALLACMCMHAFIYFCENYVITHTYIYTRDLTPLIIRL